MSDPSEQLLPLHDQSDLSDTPACPRCGKPMRQRITRKGSNAGQRFWGCIAYPDCKGTRPVSDPSN